jgi:hypothetical protein
MSQARVVSYKPGQKGGKFNAFFPHLVLKVKPLRAAFARFAG